MIEQKKLHHSLVLNAGLCNEELTYAEKEVVQL